MTDFFYREKPKKILKQAFIEGRGQAIGRPLYRATINLELGIQRAIDALRPTGKEDQSLVNTELTAVIKTLERPRDLKRLLASVRRFYPHMPVIIVDDSRQPQDHPGVQTITMPYNSGVSAGRNEGLRHVTTRYLLLLDDDFIFYRKTNLPGALALMTAEPRIDIMGGEVVNLPFYQVNDYRKANLYPTEAQATMPPGSSLAGLPVYDKVPNFYIAQTKSLRRVLWNEHVKRLDHAEFFTRAKGVLTTVYNSRLRCLHVKTYFDEQYLSYRHDTANDQEYILREYYGFSQIEEQDQ